MFLDSATNCASCVKFHTNFVIISKQSTVVLPFFLLCVCVGKLNNAFLTKLHILRGWFILNLIAVDDFS